MSAPDLQRRHHVGPPRHQPQSFHLEKVHLKGSRVKFLVYDKTPDMRADERMALIILQRASSNGSRRSFV